MPITICVTSITANLSMAMIAKALVTVECCALSLCPLKESVINEITIKLQIPLYEGKSCSISKLPAKAPVTYLLRNIALKGLAINEPLFYLI